MTEPTKGQRIVYPAALWDDMERLWVTTTMPGIEIADRINASYGTAFTGKQIEWNARRRCWNRDLVNKSQRNRHVMEERMFTSSVIRSGAGKRDDNPVVRVAPGTFPARGFRLGAGS